MTATLTPKFRYVGVTDECVECEKCGKADLRSTVVLAFLDADGNEEGITYYGSTCAARALAEVDGRRRTGKAVLDMARAAARRLKDEADDNRRMLAHYGVDGQQPFGAGVLALATAKYARQHENARWAPELDWDGWEDHVYDMVARRGAVIREAERFGL